MKIVDVEPIIKELYKIGYEKDEAGDILNAGKMKTIF